MPGVSTRTPWQRPKRSSTGISRRDLLTSSWACETGHIAYYESDDGQNKAQTPSRVRFDLSANVCYPPSTLTPEPSPAFEEEDFFKDFEVPSTPIKAPITETSLNALESVACVCTPFSNGHAQPEDSTPDLSFVSSPDSFAPF